MKNHFLLSVFTSIVAGGIIGILFGTFVDKSNKKVVPYNVHKIQVHRMDVSSNCFDFSINSNNYQIHYRIFYNTTYEFEYVREELVKMVRTYDREYVLINHTELMNVFEKQEYVLCIMGPSITKEKRIN
jgi:hypothetical protein